MKKIILVAMLLSIVLPVSADSRQINVFGGVGFSFSDVEGVTIELGAEMELLQGFYLQVMANSYLSDRMGGNFYYYSGGQLHYTQQVSSRPYGLNLYGLYKFRASRRLKVFGKAGVHVAFRMTPRYDYYYYDSYYYGYNYYNNYYYDDSGPKKSGVGTAFGIGIEHELTKKLALVVGGTYKMLFDEGSEYAPAQGNSRWFKMYTSIKYRVK
jgi:hypothetical protein